MFLLGHYRREGEGEREQRQGDKETGRQGDQRSTAGSTISLSPCLLVPCLPLSPPPRPVVAAGRRQYTRGLAVSSACVKSQLTSRKEVAAIGQAEDLPERTRRVNGFKPAG